MDIIKKGFGGCLKNVRKQKGFTQEQLAEAVSINPRQLARIEAGESFVTSETLLKICTTLSVTPYMLFEFNIQEEILKNGTNEQDMYVNIVTNNNIVNFIDKNNTSNKNLNYSKFEKSMFATAKKLSKNIIVEELKANKVFVTKIYKPNGQVEVRNTNTNDSLFEAVGNKLEKLANDNRKLEFVNMAIDALDDDKSLKDLKIFIRGYELANKL